MRTPRLSSPASVAGGLVVLAVVTWLLPGCQISKTDDVSVLLDRIGNTVADDLATAKRIAMAATPPDQAGADCADAVTKVHVAVVKVMEAARGGTVGAFSVGELATIFQPGSPQVEAQKAVLLTGCSAKVAAVNHAAITPAAILAAIPTFMVLAAPIGL